VDLKDPLVLHGAGQASLGDLTRTTITIIDDDLPGKLSFENEELIVEDDEQSQDVTVTVHRNGGATGKVSCSYYTENDSAVGGKDFVHTKGVLSFESGQTTASFKVVIMPKGRYESTESFRVYLVDPEGGATFDRQTDGGDDACVLTVVIQASQVMKDRVAQVMQLLNWDRLQEGNLQWRDQFMGAIYCGGSPEDHAEANVSDWVMHLICLPWKIIFAFIPPTEYAHGWVSFYSCLVMIGLVTMLISDLANLLGCSLGVSSSITAVTLVALGTSLPDTFASMTAAVQDRYADASIGNVTGSNSVNVFLGIGLPWTLASLKWAISGSTPLWDSTYEGRLRALCPEGCFIVPAGGLAFSVSVFSCEAIVCILILMIRRRFGGELGGPRWFAYGTSAVLVGLWALFISLYIWHDGQGA